VAKHFGNTAIVLIGSFERSTLRAYNIVWCHVPSICEKTDREIILTLMELLRKRLWTFERH